MADTRSNFSSPVPKIGAVFPFHFKVPICDLWEDSKIYDIDSCRDYICGQKHELWCKKEFILR
jgi:hypothetical protein